MMHNIDVVFLRDLLNYLNLYAIPDAEVQGYGM